MFPWTIERVAAELEAGASRVVFKYLMVLLLIMRDKGRTLASTTLAKL
jgi:hypothetical protein